MHLTWFGHYHMIYIREGFSWNRSHYGAYCHKCDAKIDVFDRREPNWDKTTELGHTMTLPRQENYLINLVVAKITASSHALTQCSNTTTGVPLSVPTIRPHLLHHGVHTRIPLHRLLWKTTNTSWYNRPINAIRDVLIGNISSTQMSFGYINGHLHVRH